MSGISRRAGQGALEPIPSVEAAEQAASQIRQAIIDGRFKPDKRLIERELTEQLNISRHPVREALRMLAREGFVELHRNRGAQVSRLDASSVVEVYAIRTALGNLALDRLIGPGGEIHPDDMKQMEKLMERALRSAKQGRHDDAFDADMAFQQAIVDASRLSRVSKYFTELTDDVHRFNRTLGILYTDQENYVRRYIGGLYAAIRDRNLEGARSIWKGKFDKAVERFLAALAGAELDGAKRVARPKTPVGTL